MGKLLRVLVVLLLAGCITALTLANKLFKQREVLKARTFLLEEYLIDTAKTFEAERPEVDTPVKYPALDIEECTADTVDAPRLSKFWGDYRQELEVLSVPTLNLERRREDLKSYYLRDEITGQIKTDQLKGTKITTGEGTMDFVLKNVITRSEDQLVLLNETRQQLVAVRRELVDTIAVLNDHKRKLRQAKVTVVEKNETIRQKDAKILTLQGDIEGLEGNVRTLKDKIAEQKTILEEKVEQIQGNRDEIARLEEELKKITPDAPISEGSTYALARGLKGLVQRAEESWNFVIIKLKPSFLAELEADPSQQTPQPTLIIKRGLGDHQQFVAKARLTRIRPEEQIGVAEILPGWQEEPILAGDQVFF